MSLYSLEKNRYNLYYIETFVLNRENVMFALFRSLM